jgi:hypothetical protein
MWLPSSWRAVFGQAGVVGAFDAHHFTDQLRRDVEMARCFRTLRRRVIDTGWSRFGMTGNRSVKCLSAVEMRRKRDPQLRSNDFALHGQTPAYRQTATVEGKLCATARDRP